MANTSVGCRVASSKRLVGEVAGSRGGSRVETLPENGRCCFVVLLDWQPLTDGICDDVLDVVEGIAGETVIELTKEEKGIKESFSSDKKMYVGTKTRKFPLPVMNMPVCVLGSVRVLAHALTGTGICMYQCLIICILFCFSYHFSYLPP
jgi:hypothetical protein